ncbi:MAG: hypothetical protein HY730_02800 [Candidatus Tectomicrobia bacterium]|uniref:Uncharacterized protein n=1 Tax=Tectimicrobiota bacterium TaxID=2528274 RepID=A0A933GKK6_UNCTE|nr:hypothetical protein [Candidatus Tectomicrobia bacterium]
MKVIEMKLLAILKQNGPEENLLHAFYKACLPIIRKIASKYSKLDVATGFEDLVNTGYFAARDTFLHFKIERGKLKITSYLVWRLKKVFTKLCTLKDRMAVINYPCGVTVQISYQKFQKIKRKLPPGAEYKVISRMVSRDDFDR